MKEKLLKWLFPKKYEIKGHLPPEWRFISKNSTFDLAQIYVKARYGDDTYIETPIERHVYIVKKYNGEIIKEVTNLHELTKTN